MILLLASIRNILYYRSYRLSHII